MMIISLMLLFLKLSAGQDLCSPTRCFDHGPTIRFPFRLKDHQQKNCGYPGFDLLCSQNNTVLELPFSVKVLVKIIDYKTQLIHVTDPNGCFPQNLQSLNLSASPFKFNTDLVYDFGLFNCPPKKPDAFHWGTCVHGDPGREVYAFTSNAYTTYLPVVSCRKMYSIWQVPALALNGTYDLQLKWDKNICGKCEADGKYCRLKNSSTVDEFECFGNIETQKGESKRKLVIAGVTVGSFILLVFVTAICWVHRLKKIKKEDQLKIERFLEDYRALKPARYSYADIKKITNEFKDKVGQGGYGTVYKGQLSGDVHVAVKILNHSKGNGEEFVNEVGIIGRIHHVNVVRLVGYCADGVRRALIYEFLPNSLEKLISSDHEKDLIGWKKLEDIALGIAKGIEYLHQGCDQRILHFDIKPHNILLDHNLNPKISDFGQAKLCSKEQSVVSMTTARGTIGYIAPEVFSRNFGNVSYKSDVYSFGMLLLEMVGGRKNFGLTMYFPEWIYNHLDRWEELGIKIQDIRVARKLAIVGLWCIQWYPVDRPSMNVVLQMLEGNRDTLTKPPYPFASTNPVINTGAVGTRPFNGELEVIVESE